MKIIKYKFLSCQINRGTEEKPEYENVILDKEIRCEEAYLEFNEEIAKREAFNGEYTIEDEPAKAPTKEEELEARLAYVEMMTGLLEV